MTIDSKTSTPAQRRLTDVGLAAYITLGVVLIWNSTQAAQERLPLLALFAWLVVTGSVAMVMLLRKRSTAARIPISTPKQE